MDKFEQKPPKKIKSVKNTSYKPKRVSNFWNNNYIEYESNCDKNRNLSLNKYLNKM